MKQVLLGIPHHFLIGAQVPSLLLRAGGRSWMFMQKDWDAATV